MATVQIDLTKKIKKMKPMHAGGQPPVTSNAMDTFFHYLTEAGIPYSRLHDVGGAFGGGKYVDIPNIFRNFDADVDDPASYDFTFTDLLLEQLFKAGVEPYFRLGVTIENAAHVKSYWIDPPKDYQKWAQICEHVVRHYTKGWANGYHYKITYWEIWNEPDNPAGEMWTGTYEEFYRLYEVTAKYLKSCYPEIKVGGYGATGVYGCHLPHEERNENDQKLHVFFQGFMKHVKESGAPLDFFSWHNCVEASYIITCDAWLREEMDRLGYADTELHLNEWDPYATELGTAHHAAEIAGVLVGMQRGHEDVCCIYDMRTVSAPYCPLFNPITHKPIHGYYSLVAFNALYQLGTQTACECDVKDLHALAASDGTHHALMLSNLTGKAQELTVTGADLSGARYHVIDQERLLSWSPAVNKIENNEVLLIEW